MGLFVLALAAFGVFAAPAGAAVPANGRVLELMTLHQPSSSKVLGVRPLSEDRNQALTSTIGPPPESESGSILNYRMSVRGPFGWEGTPLGLPYHAKAESVFPLFAPVIPADLSSDEKTILWLTTTPLTPDGQEEGILGLYRTVDGGAPEYIASLGEGIIILGIESFTEMSDNGERVVFTSPEHLVPGDANRTEGESVYTWTKAGGVELAEAKDDGQLPTTCGSRISHYNGVAADGSRVFFTTSAFCGEGARVFMRNLNTHHTVEISKSECTRGDCNAASAVRFAGATADGKFAYMTTTQQLTNADEDSAIDLYRYNVDAGNLTLVSGAGSTGNVVEGRVFPSEDDSRVYFRGRGEIIPGELTSGEKLFMADSGGLHLVAEAEFPADPGAPIYLAPVQLSANGQKALFVTASKVSGEDTDSTNDAYLYDAGTGHVTLISKGPSGGNGAFGVSIETLPPANMHEYEFGDLRPYWAITANGEWVFFQTEEGLVPEDTNGAYDVYEWRNGSVGMISPGTQPLKSEFAGISRDGRSALIETNASLVPADVDGEGRDIYDSHLEGGFPEPPPPGECTRATCPLPAGQRVVREDPASMGAAPKPGKKSSGKLSVLGAGSKPKKGTLSVVVSVPAPGAVSATLWSKQGGKKVVLASGGTHVSRAGKATLSLKLTRAGKQAKGVQHAHLTVSEGSAKASRMVKVKFG